MSAHRLRAAESVLLIIDVQEKLLAHMPDAHGLVRNVGFLIDVAQLLTIPVRATEQYPRGLGPTIGELARRLPEDRPAKTAFSACGAPGVISELRAAGRSSVVLAGMETHVCVLQTALDLLTAGLHVFLPADATSSRFPIDHDTALRRLESAGAVLTTAETTAFEWLGGAEHPQFKAVSKLIKARSLERGTRN
jgi:nicotinamidase-related amidase